MSRRRWNSLFLLRRQWRNRRQQSYKSKHSDHDVANNGNHVYNNSKQKSPRHFVGRLSRAARIKVLLLSLVVLTVWNVWSSRMAQRHEQLLSKPVTIHNYTMYQDDKHNIMIEDGFDAISNLSVFKQQPNQAVNNRVRNEDHCQPIIPVHDASFPSCNDLHELDLQNLMQTQQMTHLGAGGIRDTWKIQQPLVQNNMDELVLKTLKLDRNPSDAWEMSFANFEAVSMAELTKSRHVMDVHGYCGQSTMNELGGKNIPDYLSQKTKLDSMTKLKFAQNAAQAIADVHATTFVHGDLRPNNFLVHRDGSLKVNDFNRGRYLRWNVTNGESCGVPWFSCHRLSSPDECIHEGLITEKIDVYQLGHFMYYLLTELKTPYGWFPDMFFIPLVKKLKRKMRPSQHVLYQWLETNTDPPIVAIRQAMKRCHTFDARQRPSAQEIAQELEHALQVLVKQ